MTAVEFLHSEYKRILKDNNVSISQAFDITDKFTEAKELEKQQIIDTVISCASFIGYEEAEQFYNKTFKK